MGKRIKRRNRQKEQLNYFETALMQNGTATVSGPTKRKSWGVQDLQKIKPLTPNQEEMFHAWYNEKNICATGSAGTGKTFLGMYLALTALLDKQEPYKKIIIVRSAVPTRELGHLPGSIEEKVNVYETPYQDIACELIGRPSTYRDMKAVGLIKFIPTSYVRGLTWNDAIVIVDECENLTLHEIDSVITRIGQNTKIILLGDSNQTDFIHSKDKSGYHLAMTAIHKMSSFAHITFNIHDIVRSDLIKEWIIARNEK